MNNDSLPYQLEYQRRKTLALSIDHCGNVTLKAPLNCPQALIQQFLTAKSGWIERKTQTIKENLAPFQSVIDRRTTLCFGKQYHVCFETVREPFIRDHSFIMPQQYQFTATKIANCIKKWASVATTAYLKDRLYELCAIMGTQFTNMQLMNAKSKWGTCNANHELRFHWRLSMLPPECADYVIVHELSHTFELNHSPRFWNIVRQFAPNYKALRKRLQTYTFIMYL